MVKWWINTRALVGWILGSLVGLALGLVVAAVWL